MCTYSRAMKSLLTPAGGLDRKEDGGGGAPLCFWKRALQYVSDEMRIWTEPL